MREVRTSPSLPHLPLSSFLPFSPHPALAAITRTPPLLQEEDEKVLS